jgi:L-alanine-DL-glutamate epimerase-like enolase superfamily enzyme
MNSIKTEPLELQLNVPFRIAHGTSTMRTNALIRLGNSYGEAALPPYYPSSVADIEAYVDSLNIDWLLSAPRHAIRQRIGKLPPGPMPALAAVDMALLDIWARLFDSPLYALLGLDISTCPMSMRSLPIPESVDSHVQKLAKFNSTSMLKLKLGSGDLAFDLEIARSTRAAFGGQICADANGAWSIPEALDILPKLFSHGLAFVEQPIAAAELDDWHVLRRMTRKPLPLLLADESVSTAEDIIGLAGAADGVNLKLAKCGGIVRTLDLISLARSLDMKVMLGCMIESSLALTAAAHLAGLVDYLDLDAALYLQRDPFHGMQFNDGRVTLPQRSGIGAIRID